MKFLPFFFGLVAAVTLCQPGMAKAQTESPQMPALRAPATSQWEILFQYENPAGGTSREEKGQESKSTSANNSRIRSIRVVKSPGLLYEETNLMSDAVQKRWIHPAVEVIQQFGQANFIVLDPSDATDPLVSKYRLGDFPELLPMKKAGYSRTEKINGREALVFTTRIPEKSGSPSPEVGETPVPSDSVGASVWIDKASGLPIRFQSGNKIWTYRFLSPVNQLPMPAEVLHLFEINEKIPPPGRDLRP